MIHNRTRYSLLRLLSLSVLLPAACFSQIYTYDSVGRLIQVAYPEGGGVAYAYDDQDNITAVVPLGLPPAPMEVQVTRLSETSARISWQPQAAANEYVVERRNLDGGGWERIATVDGRSSAFIDGNLAPGGDYAYRVRSITDEGGSAPSKEATFSGPPMPQISEGGVINGASFEADRPIAPGSMISVFGENIGIRLSPTGIRTIVESADSLPLGTELGGYSLRFGHIEAPLFFVGGDPTSGPSEESKQQGPFTGQLNAQVPWEVPLGETQARIVYRPDDGSEQVSDPVTVPVAAVSPALFTFDFGPGRAAALNVKVDEGDDVVNGSIAQPVGAFPGASTQPAKLGGVVTLFANGLGPTDPPARTGDDSVDALRRVRIPLRVFVGGAEAQVLFAGLAPQFVGLYQINIIVPLGTAPGGAVPVIIEQGGIASRTDVTIAVRP